MSLSLFTRLASIGIGNVPPPWRATAGDVAAALGAPAHEGVVALLGAAIAEGMIVVDDEQLDVVTAAWAEVMARCVQLDALLQQVSATLAAAAIEHRSLKGAAVATLDEVTPAWRSYSDVDVLVPHGSLMAAVRALEALQLRPLVAPVSGRWAEQHAKSITLVHPSGTQVDLHRLLAPGVFGQRIRSTSLFRDGQEFTVGGRPIPALGLPARFLHACYHASLGGVRGTRHLRDVRLLADAVAPSAVADCWAEGWSPTVVAEALAWVADSGVELPAGWNDWLQSVEPDPGDRSLLATYTGGFGEQAAASARSARGPWSAATYSWPLLWPSRAHLRSRGRSRVKHLRSVLRPRVLRTLRRKA